MTTQEAHRTPSDKKAKDKEKNMNDNAPVIPQKTENASHQGNARIQTKMQKKHTRPDISCSQTSDQKKRINRKKNK